MNEAVAIRSFERYRRVFGGHCEFSFVSHALQHYFMHGGSEAVVVRVANRATRASVAIPAGEQTLRLQARQPGRHEFVRVSIDYDGLEESPDCFNLVVQQLADRELHLVQDQELFPALSVDPANRRFVVDVLKDSKIVRLAGPVPVARPKATRANHPGEPIPYIEMNRSGSDGEELTDYDIIGSNSEGTGLFALERAGSFDLLCIPPAPHADPGLTTFVAAERYCERRRALLIWDPQWSWVTAADALSGVRQFGCTSRNAMTYFPRIRGRGDAVRYPAGLPACGALAGALARADSAGIWRDWSTNAPTLSNAFTTVGSIDAKTVSALKRFGINALVPVGGRVELHGDVTLAGTGVVSNVWRSLRRRRLAFFILNSIERSSAWVPQQLESASTPSLLQRQVETFLRALFERGALAATTTEHAFLVSVTASAGTPPGVRLRVGFALQRPGELVVYDFEYERSGVTLKYAAGLEAERLIG